MAIRYAAQQEGEDALIAEINTTPLVDVMLVLLIIFLITIPVFNSSIAVALPREQNEARDPQVPNAIVTVDADGAIYWFDARLPNRQALAQQLAVIALREPQPELHIRADARADYDAVGQVVFSAQQMGIRKIGFLTEPPTR